ncbi:MAG: hypothetical protein ACRC0S_00090 [Fusobacteriaceae bacterium]
MSRKKLKLIIFSCLYAFNIALSNAEEVKRPETKPYPKPESPLIPLIPGLPTEQEDTDEIGNKRHLEKNYTVMVEAKVNIFVPLEIVSDIDVSADVFGEQVVNVPFTVELNREPERADYYKLKYSETELDIDKDGRNDVFIYSPEFINTRYITDNYVQVHGDKITKEGSYKKTVYVTIEAGL